MTNPFALDTTTTPAPANPFAAPASATVPASAIPSAVDVGAAVRAAPTSQAAHDAAFPAPMVQAAGDPFSGPAPQEARGPRMRDLYGRLLLVIPHKVEYGVPNRLQPGTTQDRMTADVITLDGGPIPFGGAPEKTPPVPHDKTAQVPHVTKRQFISNTGLISQCREALAKRQRGEPGMVLGRLTVGQVPANGGNPPYLLAPFTPEEAQLARNYLATVDPFA